MTTPRAHVELAKLYFSDDEMGCWRWVEVDRVWRLEKYPNFFENGVYHVGKTAPTEPPQIMCELAGVKFPLPACKELNNGDRYIIPDPACPDDPVAVYWDGHALDKCNLNAGLVQFTKEGAIQQGRAMAAALKQAIEKAKEKSK